MASTTQTSQASNSTTIPVEADKPGRTIVLEEFGGKLSLAIEPSYDHWTWLSRADAAKLVIALGLWVTQEKAA